MKIVFLSTGHPELDIFPPRGGWQYQTWHLGKELVKRGHEVVVLTRYRGKRIFTYEGIRFYGIKTYTKMPIVTHLIFSYFAYKELLKMDFDVLFMWGERFANILPSFINKSKTFFVDWDATEMSRKYLLQLSKINYLFLPLKLWIDGVVRKNSNILFAMNSTIFNYLINTGYSKVIKLPLGVEINEYANLGEEKYLLYVGRLHRSKGIEDLISAFVSLPRKFSEYELLIIGSGPNESRLKQLVEKNSPKVKFLGNLPNKEVRKYFSKCTVFILPSYFEGFGIVILEALASGKPVIASNIMGPREIINHGFDGFLFEKGNVQELRKYLERVLSDKKLREKIGRNARKTVEDKYSFEKITDNLVRILNDDVVLQ
jgi:glycosyltransferase involved in cell wall biosynthesis